MLLYSPSPCLFLVHPIIAYIATAHGPFAWHDRTEIKPSNTEGESCDFSFHLWTALLNIPIHMSLTSPNHSCLFLFFPLSLLPCLPPLGKPEEVYGVCATEEHRKGLKVLGKRPGPQLPWSRHRRWGRLSRNIPSLSYPSLFSSLICLLSCAFSLCACLQHKMTMYGFSEISLLHAG